MAKLAPAPTWPSKLPYVLSRPSRKAIVDGLPSTQRPILPGLGSNPKSLAIALSQFKWAFSWENGFPAALPVLIFIGTPHSFIRISRAPSSPSHVSELDIR